MPTEPKTLDPPGGAWLVTLLAWAWAAWLGTTGLLTIFRTAVRSSLAGLIEFKDVPILAFLDTWFGTLAWVCAGVGLALAGAAVFAWRRRPDRTSATLAVATCLTVGAAILGNRYSHDEAGKLQVADPGRLTWADLGLVDWLFLAGAVVTVVSFMRWLARELGAAPVDPDAPPPAGEGGGLALVYLLSVAAVVAAAVFEHIEMWQPEQNGGFRYARFLAEGELVTANLVLFSTSLLFASLAGLAASGWWLLHRLSARDRSREVLWQAVLLCAAFATVTTVPWLARLTIEIQGEGNVFFVPAIVLSVFALLAPLVFLSGYLLREDFARAPEAVELTRGERALFTACLFPLYPALRQLVPARHRWVSYGFYFLSALGFLAASTWVGYQLDELYEFEDWRGMFKKGLFPVLRVSFSVAAAAGVIVVLDRARRSLRAFADGRTPRALVAGRWALNAAALASLVFASWPFWGWGRVPKNVLTRTAEFNDRHEFERQFLQYLLDFDGDGYAGVLQGGDPDDGDARVQSGGIGPLRRVELPRDRLRIVDPAKAKAFPNLLIFFLEGTTPKVLCGYGQRKTRRATPGMDGVLFDGARFTRAYCPYPSTWDGWFTTVSGRLLSIQEFESSVPFKDRYSRYNNLHQMLKLIGFTRWCYPNVRPFKALFLPAEDQDENFEDDFRPDTSQAHLPEGTTKGELRADRMVRFLESLKPGERFFLAEHLSDGHFPWKRVPDEVAARLGFKHGLSFVEDDAYVDGQFIGLLARYYHAMSRCDAQVSKVVEALKRLKLYDDTLIVIVSDHGCQWYEHERTYYVSHLYQQSLQVPLVIKVPGKKQDIAIDVPVVQMDILPTLMDLAGVASERPLFGHSVAPLLDGSPPSPALRRKLTERDLLLKTHYDMLGVMSGFRHKLIFDRPVGTYLLFDLERDPMEMDNLADRRPDLLQSMLAKLRAQVREHMIFLGGIEPSHR